MTTTINSELKPLTTRSRHSAAIMTLLTLSTFPALAQQENSNAHASHQQESALDDRLDAGTLIRAVRQATERFKDVAVAEAEGYKLQFGCVTGDDSGAMGLHYINGDILSTGVLDASRPQIVIYEPTPGGGRKLIGADFLVFADAWNATHKAPPELMGQLFHLFTSPNRFGLPAFYTLHVWAWKENPLGAFVNWHPDVACKSFSDR